MAIRILDSNVATQIAAGEVVERPASVARELIENALDAGAHRILVESRGGGLRELRVQDDGSGIPSNQVELAFQRHATSKLTNADDLWAIGTLGFRGEALPAIASVAQVVCITRGTGEEVGLELRIAGGEVQSRNPTGSPIGTDISVRNLFYNTPVRREFLRSEASEATAVAAVVTQYALAYPEVRFTLMLEGRLALQTFGDGDLRSVLIELYGLDITRQLLPVELQQGEGPGAVSVRGLASPPGLTRSSRSALHLFINRRVVQPRGPIAIVVEEAYNNLLPKGRHPFAVLNIALHPAAVDVNIHPTKSEVKFRDAPRVLGAVGRAVRDALLASGAPLWDADRMPEALQTAQRRFELRQLGGGWAQAEQPANMQQQGSAEEHKNLSPWNPGQEQGLPISAESIIGAFPALSHSMATFDGLHILGQAQNSYIVADTREGIVLIDQHAAHERVIYEQIQSQHAVGHVAIKQLAQALTIDLLPDARELLLTHGHILAEWGFAIEDFGIALRVRSIPEWLPEHRVATVLHELATAITQIGTQQSVWNEAFPAILANHMAIQADQVLSLEEISALVAELSHCQERLSCPHGRPIITLLTTDQITRYFAK
ncbi:MAG: DNA mismatch repair endonuclease MutL [Roseiflexaceae bacterium]|nr:DNA mismatch repair endonuclease MutL [Roseiflexaceae bacterium]